MKKHKFILVIGCNSFAGNTFVNFLIKKGYKVLGVSRPRLLEERFNSIINKKNFKFFGYDLNKNLNSIFDLILKYEPKYIIDFAAQGMVAQSWLKPDYWFQTNLVSKVKLHKFLVNKKFLKKFINISTPEVYGNYSKKLKTNFAMRPSTPYAVSKASVDLSLSTFASQYGFPCITARFANFYGPYQTLYRIIPLTIHKAAHKKIIDLHGGGTSKRFFIYSEDFSDAIYKLLVKGKTGSVYHFSGDKMITIKDLVKKIYSKFDLNFNDFVNVTPDRPGKDMIYDMDDSFSKEDLGWKNNYNLDIGIDKTIKWYLKFNNKFKESDEIFKLKK